MRHLAVVAALLCAGCASYTTPGGPARLADLDVADAAEVATRQPSPDFPASIGVVRVQANGYRSQSLEAYGEGRYSVIAPPELLGDAQLTAMSQWPMVDTVTTLNRQLLPTTLESLDDLRLAAAKLQMDVLLVFTLDTRFQLQGKAYGPLADVSLGAAPDAASSIEAKGSAVFIDVRTGYTYGKAEAGAAASNLGDAWKSKDVLDSKRLEIERQAVAALLAEAATSWNTITRRYQ